VQIGRDVCLVQGDDSKSKVDSGSSSNGAFVTGGDDSDDGEEILYGGSSFRRGLANNSSDSNIRYVYAHMYKFHICMKICM
jgi:hypothetical protein